MSLGLDDGTERVGLLGSAFVSEQVNLLPRDHPCLSRLEPRQIRMLVSAIVKSLLAPNGNGDAWLAKPVLDMDLVREIGTSLQGENTKLRIPLVSGELENIVASVIGASAREVARGAQN